MVGILRLPSTAGPQKMVQTAILLSKAEAMISPCRQKLAIVWLIIARVNVTQGEYEHPQDD
jgi:hypothetical protein